MSVVAGLNFYVADRIANRSSPKKQKRYVLTASSLSTNHS